MKGRKKIVRNTPIPFRLLFKRIAATKARVSFNAATNIAYRKVFLSARWKTSS
jgi:hypothetical protein